MYIHNAKDHPIDTIMFHVQHESFRVPLSCFQKYPYWYDFLSRMLLRLLAFIGTYILLVM
jgi:hypothetical protein